MGERCYFRAPPCGPNVVQNLSRGLTCLVGYLPVEGFGPWRPFGPGETGGRPSSRGSCLIERASPGGAVLVGVGGARWLTNEVDKKPLRAAAGAAAGTPPSSDLAARISTASPAGALRMAMTK